MTDNPCSRPTSLLRLSEVKRLTGLSEATIYRLEAKQKFPARVRVSDRVSAWRDDEVLKWIDARPRVTAA